MYVILIKDYWPSDSLIKVSLSGVAFSTHSIKCATKFSSYDDAEKYIVEYNPEHDWQILSLEEAEIRDIIT
jgi:hypothetical protein